MSAAISVTANRVSSGPASPGVLAMLALVDATCAQAPVLSLSVCHGCLAPPGGTCRVFSARLVACRHAERHSAGMTGQDRHDAYIAAAPEQFRAMLMRRTSPYWGKSISEGRDEQITLKVA